MLPLSFVTAAAMLAVWFPLTALWHQQVEINSTTTQIASIAKQSQDLKGQARSVSTKSAEEMLARSQYQLVSPGQSLIQVLPGDGSGYVSQSTGDPGLQPLVAPLSALSLSASTSSTSGASHGPHVTFLSRFVRTLEFWR
jgi:hypothetical protein